MSKAESNAVATELHQRRITCPDCGSKTGRHPVWCVLLKIQDHYEETESCTNN